MYFQVMHCKIIRHECLQTNISELKGFFKLYGIVDSFNLFIVAPIACGGYILGTCHVADPCFDNFMRFIHVYQSHAL